MKKEKKILPVRAKLEKKHYVKKFGLHHRT